MEIRARIVASGSVLLLAAALCRGTETDASALCRATNRQVTAAWHAARAETLKGRDDILLAPGLVADRTARRIELRAEATGLSARDPIEFFLVGEDSGHDYEAVAVALARPKDIHDALLFIGMRPGRATDPRAMRFWPRGERVALTLDGIRVETLVYNTREKAPLRAVGLVFIGSTWVVEDGMDERRLAADRRDPFSIAANYNEPASLLDVPWQAPQAAVYERQVLNPERLFPDGKLLTVVIEPEYKDGRPRVCELAIEVAVAPDADAEAGLDAVRFGIRAGTEPALNGTFALDRAVAAFGKLVADGRDPFVSLSFADGMRLALVHKACGLLQTIDTEQGIRIDAPPEGQLYYKAMVPPAAFRDRAQRSAQPWELHMTRKEGALVASLVKIAEHWDDGADKPRLETNDYAVASPAELCTALERLGPGLPVILVYAPGDATYGDMMAYLRPAMKTHPVVHVFIE